MESQWFWNVGHRVYFYSQFRHRIYFYFSIFNSLEVNFLKTVQHMPACKTDIKPNMMMMINVFRQSLNLSYYKFIKVLFFNLSSWILYSFFAVSILVLNNSTFLMYLFLKSYLSKFLLQVCMHGHVLCHAMQWYHNCTLKGFFPDAILKYLVHCMSSAWVYL